MENVINIKTPYGYNDSIKAIKTQEFLFITHDKSTVDLLMELEFKAISFEGIDKFDYSIFKDVEVYFINDTKENNSSYQEKVFSNLKEYVACFKVIDLEENMADWIKNGGTKSKIEELMQNSWDWKVSKEWKYVTQDAKGNIKPILIWENLDILLKRKNIICKYNELSKMVEFKNIQSESLGANAVLEDIYSLCRKEHFNMSKENLSAALNRIAKMNSYNPVRDYLNKCLENYDKKGSYIRALCNTIECPSSFDNGVKELYIEKWLLNVANIAFNDKGEYNSEGILVLQGGQGLGKTRWIKTIVPNSEWVKTGRKIDPSNKDSIYESTKYWITELGELDATMKKDQAELKAFFTESKDVYRRPYERFSEEYPRLTAFYATVNKEEFLKDETGNRRYWVIPVTNILVDHDIDLDQLWGEVMYLLKVKKYPHWLTKDNIELLSITNEKFEVKDDIYIKIQDAFVWDAPKISWDNRLSATEIGKYLDIKQTSKIKATLEKFGVTQKRSNGKRFFELPPINSSVAALLEK